MLSLSCSFLQLFESNHANIFKVAAKNKRAFLKRVISEIESHGSEVIEELYNLYVDLISSPDEEEEFAFRSYFLVRLYRVQVCP